ncbi:lipid IV(A) 3-deoxy-D-manno-octulosonic acid transferase [Congregibacter litoralis]|uniref:lipid IV(A) 3-deoxy-D-manno-octulosonic acid transferase n=1 Tax=Congregibacter litoralis TaxID=393662 RepID=UPI00006B1871|nr:lipid IV(A) 3-deoxy-D-manno-octulosonic acid transferase [Congregibacter litoralis]
MVRFAYSMLFTVLQPFIVLRMLLRSRRAPAYRQRLGERFGFFDAPDDTRPCIWIHAVSLGETLAAGPLVERILKEHPDHRVIVTTTTPTGSAQVKRLFGERVFHVYAPWDTPGAVKRFLKRARPRLLILMETELWPNLLYYAQRSGCQVLLANARLSARSAAGYARVERLTREMLAALDWVGVQNATDGERFLQLGLDPRRLRVTGSVKFDVAVDDATRCSIGELSQQWALGERFVIIFASTHEGEDEVALSVYTAFRQQHKNALLLLAPRHPERFQSVYELCTRNSFEVARRSQTDPVDGSTDLLLLDSLGELSALFGVADLAVIGGSFIDRGGHNPLEAAAWGIPVLCGPSMFNFEDITVRLSTAGALQRCADEHELLRQFELLASDAREKRRRGAAALEVLENNRGALDALCDGLTELLGRHP